MSEEVTVKETVQELTKAKAENVSLTGRLEGFELEHQKLGELLDAAKLENAKLRRRLSGRINELDAEDHDEFGAETAVVSTTEPGEEKPSPSRSDASFFNINEHDLEGFELDGGTELEGAAETDAMTLDDAVQKHEDGRSEYRETDSWEPIHTDASPDFLGQRRVIVTGSPPRLTPQPADLHRQMSDLAASLDDGATGGPTRVTIATKLTKLADEFYVYDEKYEKDQRALDELRARCQDQKNRVQELEVELLKEKYNNAMLTPVRSEETQTEPGTPETPYRDKLASLEAKIERMTKDRDALYDRINKLIQTGRKEQAAIQTRFDTAQQELRLQMQTNQALQARVSELEDERWRSQQEINDLRRENDQLRDDRRVTLASLAPSMSSIRANVEQELEIARCQAETFRDDFDKEHEEKGKLVREVDELSQKLKTVVDQFDKLKYSSERKERMLKRKVETTEKNNRDLSKILEEFERRATTTVHGNATPTTGTTPPADRSQAPPPRGAVSSRERALAAANTRGNVQNWATGNFPIDIRARGAVGGTPQGDLVSGQAPPWTAPYSTPVKPVNSAPMTETQNYGDMTVNMHPIMNTERPNITGSLRPTAPLAVALPPVIESGQTSILEPHWPCPVCTFSNFPGLNNCEMCNQPRYSTSDNQPVRGLDRIGTRSPPR